MNAAVSRCNLRKKKLQRCEMHSTNIEQAGDVGCGAGGESASPFCVCVWVNSFAETD